MADFENPQAVAIPAVGPSSAFYGLPVVTTRNYYANDNSTGDLSSGTQLSVTSRLRYKVAQDCSDIRVAFFNGFATDAVTTGAMTVKATLELSDGTLVVLSFQGKRTATLDRDCLLVSDPVGAELVSGADVFVRTYVTVANGVKFPQYVEAAASLGEGDNHAENTDGNNSGIDQTDVGTSASANSTNSATFTVTSTTGFPSSGTFYLRGVAVTYSGKTTTTFTGCGNHASTVGGEIVNMIQAVNAFVFGPCAIVGHVRSHQATVLIVGDSIINGLGDSTFLASLDFGFAPIALNGTRAWVKISCPSEQAAGFATHAGRKNRIAAARACSSAICNYFVNDLGVYTLAQAQANLVTIWNLLNVTYGLFVWQTTCTPITTSSDSWATTGNQTLNAQGVGTETIRVQFNTWIRDGAPLLAGVAVATGSSAAGTLRAGQSGHPLAGYFETADTVETARNSGLWKVTGAANAYTSDGIHPSHTAHVAMAAAITVASLV